MKKFYFSTMMFAALTLCSVTVEKAQADTASNRKALLRAAQTEVLQQVRQAIASRKTAAAAVKVAQDGVTRAKRKQKAAEKVVATAEKALEAVTTATSELKKLSDDEISALAAWKVAFNDLHKATTATPATDPTILALRKANEDKLNKVHVAAQNAVRAKIKKIKKDLKLTTYEEDASVREVLLALVVSEAKAQAALAAAKVKLEAADDLLNDAVDGAVAKLALKLAALKVEDRDLQESLLPLLQFEENALTRLGNTSLEDLNDAVDSLDDKTAEAIKALTAAVGKTTNAVQGVRTEVKAVGKGVTKVATGLDGVKTEVANVVKSVDGVKTEVAKVATEVAGLRADLTGKDGAITRIVTALAALKPTQAKPMTAKELKVVVNLPDEELKKIALKLERIATILEGDNAADSLTTLTELLTRYIADAKLAKEAKQVPETVYEDSCGHKYVSRKGRWFRLRN